MSEQKHIPEWIKQLNAYGYPNYLGETHNAFNDGAMSILKHIGLSDVDNPAEWVKSMNVNEQVWGDRVKMYEDKLEMNNRILESQQSENERLKAELKSVSENERNMLERLVQQLKDYTRESHNILGFDDREPKEFVDIFYDSLFNKN